MMCDVSLFVRSVLANFCVCRIFSKSYPATSKDCEKPTLLTNWRCFQFSCTFQCGFHALCMLSFHLFKKIHHYQIFHLNRYSWIKNSLWVSVVLLFPTYFLFDIVVWQHEVEAGLLFGNSSPSLLSDVATRLSRLCCVATLGAGIFVLLLLLFVLLFIDSLVLPPIGVSKNSSLTVSLWASVL